MQKAFKPRCPARPDWEHGFIEAFCENPPPTMRDFADKTARDNTKMNALARTGQV
jgi:hypothetical protein